MPSPAQSFDPLMMLNTTKDLGTPEGTGSAASADQSNEPAGVDQLDSTANLGTTRTDVNFGNAPHPLSTGDQSSIPAGVDSFPSSGGL